VKGKSGAADSFFSPEGAHVQARPLTAEDASRAEEIVAEWTSKRGQRLSV